MSYHQPPPNGPYGQQPQQPNPYGAGPQPYGPPGGGPGYQQPPAQPGYGYPGQPGQPPYGQPQQPGGFVPPPPPRKRSTGKVIGLAVGAVVVVGAVIGGILYATGDSGIVDDGPHKLVVPEAVGEYTLDESSGGSDPGGADDEEFQKMLRSLGVSDGESVDGEYSTVDMSDPGALDEGSLATMRMAFFGGVWGTVDDPERAVDDFFTAVRAEAEKDPSEDGELVGDPRPVSPDGLDGAVMKCQEIKLSGDEEMPAELRTSMCVWADHSTVGMVMPMSFVGGMSVDDSAEVAADFRKESRVKAE